MWHITWVVSTQLILGTSKQHSCFQGLLWECHRAGNCSVTLWLHTTRMRSHFSGRASGVTVIHTNKQTKGWESIEGTSPLGPPEAWILRHQAHFFWETIIAHQRARLRDFSTICLDKSEFENPALRKWLTLKFSDPPLLVRVYFTTPQHTNIYMIHRMRVYQKNVSDLITYWCHPF